VTAAADGPQRRCAATATVLRTAASWARAPPGANERWFTLQTTANTQTTNDKVSAQVGTPAFNDELGGKSPGWPIRVQSAFCSFRRSTWTRRRAHLGAGRLGSVAFNANHADARAALEQALRACARCLPRRTHAFPSERVATLTSRQSQKQAVAAMALSAESRAKSRLLRSPPWRAPASARRHLRLNPPALVMRAPRFRRMKSHATRSHSSNTLKSYPTVT